MKNNNAFSHRINNAEGNVKLFIWSKLCYVNIRFTQHNVWYFHRIYRMTFIILTSLKLSHLLYHPPTLRPRIVIVVCRINREFFLKLCFFGIRSLYVEHCCTFCWHFCSSFCLSHHINIIIIFILPSRRNFSFLCALFFYKASIKREKNAILISALKA